MIRIYACNHSVEKSQDVMLLRRCWSVLGLGAALSWQICKPPFDSNLGRLIRCSRNQRNIQEQGIPEVGEDQSLLLSGLWSGAEAPRMLSKCCMMGDEIPGSVQLAVDEAVRHAGAMDQLGELLVSTTDAGASVPLRLVPVGGGQFLLAKLTEDPPDAVGLVGDASPGDEELKRQLAAVQGEVVARLERLSRKLSKVADRCQGLGDRLLQLTARLTHAAPAGPSRTPRGSVTVSSPAGGTVEDYPNGSWLGDPMDPEARIRVPIASADLDMVNRTCTTPEKMALTLLDFLFDRQVQATSNISGTGRHGKHQLDPLRIFGIRCHLVYQFGIGEHDWHRIKQNMDSKCRTAFRRKHRGMSLVVKAFRDRAPQGAGHRGQVLAELGSASSVPITLLSEDMAARIASMEPQIIRTEHGDIQVVQATAEQLAQMEGDPRIHILASAQVLSTDEQEADDDLQP